jgi:hypothetical protein
VTGGSSHLVNPGAASVQVRADPAVVADLHRPGRSAPVAPRLERDFKITNGGRGQENRAGDRRFRWSPALSPAKGYVARGGVEPPTFRFSVGRSYQLSYLAGMLGSCYPAGGVAADRITCSDTQIAAR